MLQNFLFLIVSLPAVNQDTWNNFWESGLLCKVNRILHKSNFLSKNSHPTAYAAPNPSHRM